MFKNQNCSFVFLAGFFILTSQVSNASIENIQSDIGVAQSDIDSPSDVEVVQTNDDAYNSYYSPIQATFTGQVKFEPRYTRVHDCENSGQPCHKSQKYWSLVIVSKGHNYVFNRELNLGEEFAPESVELAGSTLKAGSIVKVDGQVTTAGVTSFFIMNIERVQVIADVGWICHSTSVNNPNVSVRVWYNLTQGEGSYKIQVEQVSDRSIYPIATVQDAQVALNSSEFIYSGTSRYSGQSARNSRIELYIRTAPHQTLDLSSSLKIETLRSGNLPWAGAVIPLKCSQSRLSAGD